MGTDYRLLAEDAYLELDGLGQANFNTWQGRDRLFGVWRGPNAR